MDHGMILAAEFNKGCIGGRVETTESWLILHHLVPMLTDELRATSDRHSGPTVGAGGHCP
jgi:hypothetical protein